MMNDSEMTRLIPLIAERGTKRGWRCPSPARLAAYREAKLGATQRTKVEKHLADCTFCLGQVGFLIREAEQQASPAVPSRLLAAAREHRPRRLHRLPTPVLATSGAAVLMLIVAVVWQWNTPVPDSKDVKPAVELSVRNGGVSSRTPRILLPEEGQTVAGSTLDLRWQETPGALHYTVWLVSLDGDVVREDRSTARRMKISTAKLEHGQRYFVWVEAHLRTGGTLKSRAVSFLVSPK